MQANRSRRNTRANSWIRDYSLVVACVAAAALARIPLAIYLDSHAVFIMFFPAIVAAAWIAGWGGGLLALVLSALIAVAVFMASDHRSVMNSLDNDVSLAIFLAVGLGISAISQSQRRSRLQAETALEREALLNRLSFAIRQSLDVHEVRQTAVEILGPALEVDRCLAAIIDEANDTARIVNEWKRPDLPSLLGEYRLSSFDIRPSEIFARGETQVVEDIETAAFSQDAAAAVRQLGIRAYVNVPLLENGTVFGLLGVNDTVSPRRWSAADIGLLESAAAQMRAVAETARLLELARMQAAHDSVVSRIGQALLATLDPEVVQWRAACLLGEALRADRCYFLSYDTAVGLLYAGEDWHRPDLPSVMGEYPLTEYLDISKELFSEGTSVIRDVRESLSPASAAALENSGQRSLLSVPLFDKDELVAALSVSMAEPRDWTPNEAALAEEVAALTRAAIASARLNQREKRIAAQLQEALQPVIPMQVPGLRLAHYYRPALKEAEVGGDFADCFSVADGQTILVVGDLSGKGLEAAAQVATVRNMLRYALYNGRTLSGPMTRLNQTLAQNRLLIGFATLFTGAYDGVSGTLRYVNCGQDPALVLRAALGVVEMLPPTGAVLGAFSDSEYREASIFLERGDILAVFTDGLTEAGPSRREMLGLEGVTRLLQQRHGEDDPQVIVERLIECVDAHARDSLRDDACLLVGVVEDWDGFDSNGPHVNFQSSGGRKHLTERVL